MRDCRHPRSSQDKTPDKRRVLAEQEETKFRSAVAKLSYIAQQMVRSTRGAAIRLKRVVRIEVAMRDQKIKERGTFSLRVVRHVAYTKPKPGRSSLLHKSIQIVFRLELGHLLSSSDKQNNIAPSSDEALFYRVVSGTSRSQG